MLKFRVVCSLLAAAATVTSTALATGTSVLRSASEAGITPHSLTIAGLTPTEAAIVLSKVEDAHVMRQTLADQHVELTSVASTVSQLREQAEGGDHNAQVEFDMSLLALTNVENALNSTRTNIRSAALDGCHSTVHAAIATWQSSAGYRVEPAMRVLSLTVSEWTAVEEALRVERRAIRRSTPTPPDAALLLTSIRNNPTVTQAQQALDAQLQTVTAVFTQFD